MARLKWFIPTSLLSESLLVMRPHGAVGNKGLALWFGASDGLDTEVTHLVELTGPGFRTTPQYLRLSLRAMSALTDLAEEINAVLIGQVHSHPARFLDLSELDKKHGIHSQGYLSVVCPYYAQRNINGFAECGVHVFENLHYRRMPPNEVSGRLILRDAKLNKIKCEVPA
jgi:hypothetical protein